MDDDQRKRDRTVLDLSPKGGFIPGMGEGQLLDLQDGPEIPRLHPPQVVELLGELPALYFFSSACDLR